MEGRIGKLANTAKKELADLTGLTPSAVIGVSEEEGEMVVKLEMVEKKSIPDGMDVLGTYEVRLDAEGKIKDFSRTRLRKRIDTSEE